MDSYDEYRNHANCKGEKLGVRQKNANSKKIEDEKSDEEAEATQPSNENSDKSFAENELNKIKADVNKLSDDLQTTVTELKKSIVDIRSAVSEIEDPFNLLRTISSEKDLKKISEERLPAGVKSLILGKPQENGTANRKIETKANNMEQQPTPELERQNQSKTETNEEGPETEDSLEVQSKPPKISSAYLDWIWDLLDSGLEASDIHQFACSCERLGYLPAQTNEFIYSLAVATEKLREKGFTKGHLLLNLYKAAAISKVNIGWEDVEALIAITEEQLKRLKLAKGAE